MPSKSIQCEFCDGVFRKDRYGIHVKSKHVKELAKQFLEDSDKTLFNPVKSLAKGYDPRNVPVYSRRDDGSLFFFGVVPRYFEKDDSYGRYINEEANMTAHKEFLRHVIDAIPLSDFLLRQGPTRFVFETLQTMKK